jgi:hypothetical protein
MNRSRLKSEEIRCKKLGLPDMFTLFFICSGAIIQLFYGEEIKKQMAKLDMMQR